MSELEIRHATVGDATAVATICNEGIGEVDAWLSEELPFLDCVLVERLLGEAA